MALPLAALAVLPLGTTTCVRPDGTQAPCGPDIEACGAPLSPAPRFHVMGLHGCLMNDPNAPFYDPVHEMFHVFWQAHLAEPSFVDPTTGRHTGAGPVWAHAASRDLVRWATLPVALWNDELYDSVGVYTGSATVDGGTGELFLAYPSMCAAGVWPTCATGGGLSIATPANRSDPLLRDWVKSGGNPVVNDTQRDPSTAWRTQDGEWRLTSKLVTLSRSACRRVANLKRYRHRSVHRQDLPQLGLHPLVIAAQRFRWHGHGQAALPAG